MRRKALTFRPFLSPPARIAGQIDKAAAILADGIPWAEDALPALVSFPVAGTKNECDLRLVKDLTEPGKLRAELRASRRGTDWAVSCLLFRGGQEEIRDWLKAEGNRLRICEAAGELSARVDEEF